MLCFMDDNVISYKAFWPSQVGEAKSADGTLIIVELERFLVGIEMNCKLY